MAYTVASHWPLYNMLLYYTIVLLNYPHRRPIEKPQIKYMKILVAKYKLSLTHQMFCFEN